MYLQRVADGRIDYQVNLRTIKIMVKVELSFTIFSCTKFVILIHTDVK